MKFTQTMKVYSKAGAGVGDCTGEIIYCTHTLKSKDHSTIFILHFSLECLLRYASQIFAAILHSQ